MKQSWVPFFNREYNHLVVFAITTDVKFKPTKLQEWISNEFATDCTVEIVLQQLPCLYRITVPGGTVPEQIVHALGQLEANIKQAMDFEGFLNMVMPG